MHRSPLKRTRQLALTTLMAAAAVNLTACGAEAPSDALTWDDSFQTAGAAAASPDAPVDAQTYADADACKAADEVPDAECDNAWLSARSEHEANAPRYGDKTACEAEYGAGNCETRSSAGGGSFFMPFLGGMILGQMMSPGGGSYYRGAGLYRDRLGRERTPYAPGGLSRDPVSGRTQIARSAIEPPSAVRNAPAAAGRSRVVSRGGFRGSGRGFGG